MKKVFISLITLAVGLVISTGAFAAMDSLKPAGMYMPGIAAVEASARLVQSGPAVMAAKAMAETAVLCVAYSEAKLSLQERRSQVDASTAVADARFPSTLKQFGIQADRGAKVRSQSTKLII